ncbi:hypothetical protein IFO70_23605 [Phormidium tenue FACHB-886]|nr:hypothetical protein [Phormidium tenue FACHB-886]
MLNLFNSQVKSVNQVELAQSSVQSSDRLWSDLSANESSSFTGGGGRKLPPGCRRMLFGGTVCREPGVD